MRVCLFLLVVVCVAMLCGSTSAKDINEEESPLIHDGTLENRIDALDRELDHVQVVHPSQTIGEEGQLPAHEADMVDFHHHDEHNNPTTIIQILPSSPSPSPSPTPSPSQTLAEEGVSESDVAFLNKLKHKLIAEAKDAKEQRDAALKQAHAVLSHLKRTASELHHFKEEDKKLKNKVLREEHIGSDGSKHIIETTIHHKHTVRHVKDEGEFVKPVIHNPEESGLDKKIEDAADKEKEKKKEKKRGKDLDEEVREAEEEEEKKEKEKKKEADEEEKEHEEETSPSTTTSSLTTAEVGPAQIVPRGTINDKTAVVSKGTLSNLPKDGSLPEIVPAGTVEVKSDILKKDKVHTTDGMRFREVLREREGDQPQPPTLPPPVASDNGASKKPSDQPQPPTLPPPVASDNGAKADVKEAVNSNTTAPTPPPSNPNPTPSPTPSPANTTAPTQKDTSVPPPPPSATQPIPVQTPSPTPAAPAPTAPAAPAAPATPQTIKPKNWISPVYDVESHHNGPVLEIPVDRIDSNPAPVAPIIDGENESEGEGEKVKEGETGEEKEGEKEEGEKFEIDRQNADEEVKDNESDSISLRDQVDKEIEEEAKEVDPRVEKIREEEKKEEDEKMKKEMEKESEKGDVDALKILKEDEEEEEIEKELENDEAEAKKLREEGEGEKEQEKEGEEKEGEEKEEEKEGEKEGEKEDWFADVQTAYEEMKKELETEMSKSPSLSHPHKKGEVAIHEAQVDHLKELLNRAGRTMSLLSRMKKSEEKMDLKERENEGDSHTHMKAVKEHLHNTRHAVSVLNSLQASSRALPKDVVSGKAHAKIVIQDLKKAEKAVQTLKDLASSPIAKSSLKRQHEIADDLSHAMLAVDKLKAALEYHENMAKHVGGEKEREVEGEEEGEKEGEEEKEEEEEEKEESLPTNKREREHNPKHKKKLPQVDLKYGF